MSAKKWKNPFYLLLLPVSAAFCITGFAYGLMAFQAVNGDALAIESTADHPLFAWLQTHGSRAMLVQLAVLAVLTIGTIVTDGWWIGEKKSLPTTDADQTDQ